MSSRVVLQYFVFFLSRESAKCVGQIRRWRHLLSLPPSFHSSDSLPHPRFPSAPVKQTLKEGATGPRRGTHIHAPGKHKHHACFHRADSRRPIDRRFEIIARYAIHPFGKRPTLNQSTDTEQDNRNTSFPKDERSPRGSRINALRTKALHFPARRFPPPLSPFTLSHAFTHTHVLLHSFSFSPSLPPSLPHSLSIRSLSCGRSLMVDVVERFVVAREL